MPSQEIDHFMLLVGVTVTAAAWAVTGVAASAAVARPTRPVTPAHATLTKIIIAMNGKTISLNRASYPSGGAEVISKVTHEPQGDPTFVRLDPGVTLAQLHEGRRGRPEQHRADRVHRVQPAGQQGHYRSPGQPGARQLRRPRPFVERQSPAGDAHSRSIKASSPARLPKPQATIASIEFGFRGAGQAARRRAGPVRQPRLPRAHDRRGPRPQPGRRAAGSPGC